jgi:outer membrane receptor protein involved in Fe transport
MGRLLVAAIFLASVVTCSAQTLGDISGEVRDASGALVTAANITLVNVDTNAVRNALTNESGLYSFPAVPPGSYRLRIEKQGFRSATRTDILLQVQQSLRLDVELQVGTVSETVEVSASAQMLSTENATVGTVIENKRIVELPLNGRNYLQLVSLAPNVSFGFSNAGQADGRQGGSRARQNISVAGQRSYFNRFTLDGVENTDPNFNTYVIQPSIDALQEFKVQSGVYPAEFGRGATQINVSTKPGTNGFHGTLFEFLRNDKLDAKNYAFTSARPPKDPFKWNQYGGTLGGPVIIPKLFNGKDRLFFMANYEAFRQRRTVQSTYTLPSDAMRSGDFSELLGQGVRIYDPATRVVDANGNVTAAPFANNRIPSSRIHPIAARLLEFYPGPNLQTASLVRNRQQGNRTPINKDQFILRMDFNESANSQWFGRYSWGDENQINEGLRLNGSKVLTNVEQYMGSNVRVLSPSTVNEVRFGYTRFFNSAGRELAFVRDVVSELNIPGLKGPEPVAWGIPSVSVQGFSGFGDDSEGPYANDNNALQFVDNFSWIRGKHALRFGGEVRRDVYNTSGNQFPRGAFLFEADATSIVGGGRKSGGHSFADFLLGYSRRSEASVSIAEAKFRNLSYAFYVDDVWKVTSNLTVNFGLRYELTPPFKDISGRLFSAVVPFDLNIAHVTDPKLQPYFLRQGTGGDPYQDVALFWPGIDVRRDGSRGERLQQTDYNDFAPRLGITWSPTPNWVVRAGAGIFYSQDTGNPRFDMARNLGGRTRFESDSSTLYTFDTAFGALAGARAIVSRPYSFGVTYDRRTPRTHMYMLNVQRELPGNTLLELGYMGNNSVHLEQLRALNEEIPGTTPHLDRVPFAQFGRIQTVDASGIGNYHGFSAKLTKRYSSGLTFLSSYTWSKAIDTGSAIRTHGGDTLFPQNSYCLRCERALSSFHTAHRWVNSFLWDIPIGRGRPANVENRVLNAIVGGWQVGSIIALQSGFPLTVVSGRDQANTGGGFDRPNATGIDPNDIDHRTNERWFNTAAFVLQPFGSFGNVGRNTLIGPSIFNWDASLLKDFYFNEQHRLQFRWEAFNVPNHPNWSNPNANVSSPGYGTIGGVRTNMRQMQLALKYIF